MVGSDRELRGDGRPVLANGEAGDVALQPGEIPGFGFQFAVDALGGGGEPDEPDEPVALGRARPATTFAALATRSTMPRRVRPTQSALCR